jgi:hypothetical protein
LLALRKLAQRKQRMSAAKTKASPVTPPVTDAE